MYYGICSAVVFIFPSNADNTNENNMAKMI